MPLDNSALEIRKIPGERGDGAHCPICGGAIPPAIGQIEVGPRQDYSPDDCIRMCQTCAVTALRRVWEYYGGRGPDAIRGQLLAGRRGG